MRNTLNVPSTYYCFSCNLQGFFVETPNGADYYTCPCCSGSDFLHDVLDRKQYHKLYDKLLKMFEEYDNDAIDEKSDKYDLRMEWNYCAQCKIIFKCGCTHRVLGCTDDIYNAHFVKKWTLKDSDVSFEGMPTFDDEYDWFENINKIQIVKEYCPHIGSVCKNNKHPITNYCRC
jgi:hypothetical protein